jgi:hypothetical protein
MNDLYGGDSNVLNGTAEAKTKTEEPLDKEWDTEIKEEATDQNGDMAGAMNTAKLEDAEVLGDNEKED